MCIALYCCSHLFVWIYQFPYIFSSWWIFRYLYKCKPSFHEHSLIYCLLCRPQISLSRGLEWLKHRVYEYWEIAGLCFLTSLYHLTLVLSSGAGNNRPVPSLTRGPLQPVSLPTVWEMFPYGWFDENYRIFMFSRSFLCEIFGSFSIGPMFLVDFFMV